MTAFSEEIRVLSGGAAKSFIEPLAATFPGHTVKLELQPMGRLTKSLAEGYPGGHVPALRSSKAEVVKAFIAHLTGPQARERLAQAGYTSAE